MSVNRKKKGFSFDGENGRGLGELTEMTNESINPVETIQTNANKWNFDVGWKFLELFAC